VFNSIAKHVIPVEKKILTSSMNSRLQMETLPLIVIKVRISSYKATPGFKIPIQTVAIKSSSSTYLY